VEDEMSVHENQIKNTKLDSISNIINLEINKYHMLNNIEIRKQEFEIKKLEEKTKQAEFEMKRQQEKNKEKELDIEILKLKQIQQPIQQQQPQIQININNIPNNNNDRQKTNQCADCNQKIHYKSTRCNNCLSKFRIVTTARNTNRPSLEQLELDLRDSSFVQVGRKYGVSDNCIRKWIKNYRKIII
jgi:hypothetical protein